MREAGVYSEIAPFTQAEEAFHRLKPKGIILSGSPAGVPEEGSPRAPEMLFEAGVPILGICYGQQVMSHQLGGEVRPGHETGEGGEFGRAYLTVTKPCALFDGLWQVGERHQVWMSHGDKVTRFAWQVVAGVRTAVSRNVDVTLRYRFFNVGDANMIAFGNEDVKGGMGSHSLLAGLTFNFGAPPP